MSFFDVRLTVRLTQDEYNRFKKLLRNATTDGFEPRYDNPSHFIRCAINKLVRQEELLGSQLQKEKNKGKVRDGIKNGHDTVRGK